MDNTAEAKPPNNENDWQAIDIYVFFNGQQYSPPRKYHLSADELNWWDATLCSLAKSLFGLMDSYINLYTTDGRRIEGPLELKDGMAYVAVEPSDTFIDAGYDKYLIRATRSWEKRQAKKASPVDDTEPAKLVNCHIEAADLTDVILHNAGCNHDQPCCLCAEKEDIVTIESERSVMVATEISTLRAPDEIYADSALGKTGQNGPWVGTFDPRTGEYIIGPAERGTINDYGTRFDGKCPRLSEQGRPCRLGRQQVDERRAPGEYARLPGEYGLTLAEQGIMPVDYGRIPVDERLKPAEYRRTPAEIKQASGERGQPPGEQAYTQSDYRPAPVKQTSNLGDYEYKTVDQRITNESPAEQDRTSGEFGGTPVDQVRAPNQYLPGEQIRTLGESEHQPGQLARIRGVYKRPTDEKIRTLGEIEYAPGKQGGTPGEYQHPSGGQDIVSVDYERTPVEQGRTPSDNRRSPGELDRGPGEYVHTSIDQGRSPSEKGRLPGEQDRTSGEIDRTPVNQRRTSGEYGRPPSEQVRTLGEIGRVPVDQSLPTREQVRTSGESGHIPVDQGRPPGEQVRTSGESGRIPITSSGYGRPPGEKTRSLGESGNAPDKQGGFPGENRCSQGCGACRRPKGEQIRSLGESGRALGEQGSTPSEFEHPGGQSHASGVYGPGGQGRTSGEHGRTPVDQGRNPVDQGRTSGENKRISGDRGRAPGGQNRNSGEYGRTAVDQGGRTQSEYGRSQGQQGRERGRIPGENGRTPGENGRTTGNYVRKPGDRGRLSGENARTSADNRRPPGDYRTNEQKQGRIISSGQGRTLSERGRTAGAHGRTFGPQRRISGEYERLPVGLETRNADQPAILSDYYPSPEESGSKVRGKPEVILSDNIDRTGEGISRSNEPSLRVLDQEDRLGERGSRVSGNGSRVADIGSRVGEQGGKRNEYQSRPVDRGGELGEPDDRMYEVITDRGSGYGGRLGELPEKETEYVTMPGGQGTMAELDGEQENDRGYNGGKQGEPEARGGDLVARLADQARFSGGGANGATGYSYVTETQRIRKSSMTSSVPKNTPGVADNKRRWSGGAHTTFKRPSPIPVSPASQRRSDDRRNSREENKKIVLKSSARSSNGATAAPNVVGKQKIVPKSPCKRFAPPANPVPASSFDQNIIKGKATSLTKIVSNHKSLTTDSAAVENIIGNKEIIFVSTNLFRNQESEITSVRLDSAGKPVLACIRGSEENQPEINHRPQSDTLIPVNEEVQTCTEQITEEIHGDRNGGSSSRHLTRTSSKTKVTRPASGPRLNMVAGDATPDENYIAIINKGDVVNLKLNIEVRSGDKTDLNHKSARSRSLTNVARTEIGSQISIVEDLVAQSKSLQSLLNNEFRGTGFEGRPKVVVVQCACCGMRPNNPPRCDTTPSENKKYFVLMPSSQVNATVDKCDCDPAFKQIYDQRIPPQIKKQSTSLPLKKTYSATSIEAVTVREGSSPFPRREVGLFMATTTTNSPCRNEVGRLECPTPRPRVSITENQIPRCNSARRSSSQISMTRNDFVASRRSNSNSRACQNLSDSSTQTEWCSVLLEARRHEDGRYSFHLPPLQVLRYYSCS